MLLLKIVKNSFIESLRFDRFFYFFFLNMFFGMSALLLLMPVINQLPEMLLWDQVTPWAFVVVVILTFLGIAVQFFHIWFEGALVHLIARKKNNFGASLNYTKRVFWQLVAFAIIFFVIRMVINSVPYVQTIGMFVAAWVLMFTVPFIVLKRDSADIAAMKSFDFVRDHWFDTLMLALAISIVTLVVFTFFILFSVSTFLSPLLVDMSSYISTSVSATPTTQEMISLINVFRSHQFGLLGLILVFSLYMAITKVFGLTVRTVYLMRKKRKL